jgi:hypothetical protein
LGVDAGVASGHVDLGSEAIGVSHMLHSKIHDIGRDSGKHTTSPVGVTGESSCGQADSLLVSRPLNQDRKGAIIGH